MSDPAGVIKFLHVIENLKRTKRTGWVDHKVDGPESIADHMHRMGVMALLIPDNSTVSKTKCIKMAIVHDLAEAIAGDITPHSGVSKEEKFRLESEAMDEMVQLLGGSPEAEEIRSLWREYEEAQSEEALLVKDLDKFEMIVQAVEYEKREGRRLDTFFKSTEGKFRHPIVKQWVEKLYEDRMSAPNP